MWFDFCCVFLTKLMCVLICFKKMIAYLISVYRLFYSIFYVIWFSNWIEWNAIVSSYSTSLFLYFSIAYSFHHPKPYSPEHKCKFKTEINTDISLMVAHGYDNNIVWFCEFTNLFVLFVVIMENIYPNTRGKYINFNY